MMLIYYHYALIEINYNCPVLFYLSIYVLSIHRTEIRLNRLCGIDSGLAMSQFVSPLLILYNSETCSQDNGMQIPANSHLFERNYINLVRFPELPSSPRRRMNGIKMKSASDARCMQD